MTDFNKANNITELRELSGMSQKEFASHFDLSIRTLQEWEQFRRTPPDYLLKMLKRLLAYEEEAKNHFREE